MRTIEHIVTAEEEGMRLDALLALIDTSLSRNAAVKLIEGGQVSVDGVPCIRKKRSLFEGNQVLYYALEEDDTVPLDLLGEDIPLDIRYEDDHLLVISKQAGLVCHPSPGHESGTLVNALIAHCGVENLATVQGGDRPGIVHRLDQDTSGLMLAAKDEATATALQEDLRTHHVDRRYLALVHGCIAPNTGQIDAPIARDHRVAARMRVSDDLSARPSVTTFTVLERFDAGRFDDGYSLLECKLYTGRTHQIRVHMNYIGHPCVGDPQYGLSSKPKASRGLERQFLHSYRLSFDHPLTGERQEYTDCPPEDLSSFLRQLYAEDLSLGRTEAGEKLLAPFDEVLMAGIGNA